PMRAPAARHTKWAGAARPPARGASRTREPLPAAIGASIEAPGDLPAATAAATATSYRSPVKVASIASDPDGVASGEVVVVSGFGRTVGVLESGSAPAAETNVL